MLSLLTIALAVAAAAAAPEKRQLPTCTNAFTLTVNPCAAGSGQTYFPVPGDAQKFVQCDILGGAYVVQCPAGQLYNAQLNACQNPAPVQPTSPSNPCTVANLNAGAIYFAVPQDAGKFFQCTGINQFTIGQCPANMIWDQSRVACVLKPGAVVVQPTQASVLTNPCTQQQIAANNLYFAHPDPTKFIQCDLLGNAYEMVCPTNLIWNQYYEVCTSSFQLNPVGKK